MAQMDLKIKMNERDSSGIGDMISALRDFVENEPTVTIKEFQEVAEEPQSMEVRKKVLDDLMKARTNEKSKEDEKVQGE